MNDEDKKHETITIGYEEILNRVFFELPYIIEELQVKLNEAKDGLTILCAQYALVEEKMKIFEGMSQSFIVPKDELEDFEDKLKKSRDLIWKNLLEDYKINKEKEATKK